MYYKLYIDSFFILQMTGNLYLLSLAGKILGCTATHVRIWLGAAAGASIACMAYWFRYGPCGPESWRALLPAVCVCSGLPTEYTVGEI